MKKRILLSLALALALALAGCAPAAVEAEPPELREDRPAFAPAEETPPPAEAEEGSGEAEPAAEQEPVEAAEPEPQEPEVDENTVAPPSLAAERAPEERETSGIDLPEYEPEIDPPLRPFRPDNEFVLSFAGDCTLGNDHGYNSAWGFLAVVGDDYDYPFAAVREYFEDDDFTMVNLECALTTYNVPAEKTYRFKGPPAYAKILSGSSVEGVTLANNHSADYGQQGLADTRAALEAEGVLYVDDGGTLLVETERGLKIGFCAFFWNGWKQKEAIASLREAGAQLVVSVWHWGDEGTYTVNGGQISQAHLAIDAGADLVIGSHPHVLQHIEQYGNGLICYSLGNFSFGGNTNPRDKDTVVFRQHVLLNEDGTASLGETELIPCRLSSVTDRNDYQPTPYEEGSADYERVMQKMAGTYR